MKEVAVEPLDALERQCAEAAALLHDAHRDRNPKHLEVLDSVPPSKVRGQILRYSPRSLRTPVELVHGELTLADVTPVSADERRVAQRLEVCPDEELRVSDLDELEHEIGRAHV